MFLNKIVETKREEIKQLKQKLTVADAEQAISGMPQCLGFAQSLITDRKYGLGLIAEVKKASPSKGLIRADFDPIAIAKDYEAAGADCLSVLTDVDYFQGSNAYLEQVRQAVNIPILRKDFTLDPLQVFEARMIGADAVLLIAAILTTEQMKELMSVAQHIGLDVLIEVHNREELERVLQLDATLIGINNRNLKTFETDLKTTGELIQGIPKETIIVSESGLSKAEDMQYVHGLGADAVLIGEHFMRQPSIGVGVEELMGSILTSKGRE